MDSKSISTKLWGIQQTIPAVLAPSSSFHTFRCVLRQQVVSTIKKVMQRESRKTWEAETYLIILEISWDYKGLFMLPRRIHLRLILWQKQLPSSNAYRSISSRQNKCKRTMSRSFSSGASQSRRRWEWTWRKEERTHGFALIIWNT